MEAEEKKNKYIKNWFILQKVRLQKFIKEHKYTSAIIGAFLLSSIIAIIVFASDDDPYAGKIKAERNGDITISSTGDPNTEKNKEVKSFSTVVYDIPFKLLPTEEILEDNLNRLVNVTATISKDIDADLTTLNENVGMDPIDEEDKKGIKLKDYVSINNSQSISVYLNVYNIKDGTTIAPDITVCDSTTEDPNNCFTLTGEDTKVTVRSKEVSLVPKTVPGLIYTSAIDGKRYIPYGILVGLRKSDINPDGSLTGIYVNPEIMLSLSATNVTITDDEQIGDFMEQVTTESYYGLYAGKENGDAKINILAKQEFPYYSLKAENPSNSPAVYNSGEITSYKKCDASDSTCNLFGAETSNVYFLSIAGIKTDGRFVEYNSKGFMEDYSDTLSENVKSMIKRLKEIFGPSGDDSDDFLAVGSYYVTAMTDELTTGSSRGFKLNVKYKSGDAINDGISYMGYESKEVDSIKQTATSFTKESGKSLEEIDKAAYGEEIIFRTLSSYQYINTGAEASHKYNLVGKVPVAAMKYTEGIEPFDIIEYGSDVSEDAYFLEVNGTTEGIENYDVKVSYVACTSLSECSMNDSPDNTYNSFEEFKIAQKEAEENNTMLYLSYVRYSLSNVPSDSRVDFRLRLTTGTEGFGEINATVSNEYSFTENGNIITYDPMYDTSTISVTPYTARLSLNVDGLGNDLLINLSNKTSSTVAVYPKISLPANLISTNKVAISKIDEMIVTVLLPDKINYVSNDNYLKPDKVEANGKKLTFILRDQKINEWIDPIYFDVSYDIDVSSNTEYLIRTIVDSKTKNNNGVDLRDISDEQSRTASASIKFLNTGEISYSMYTSNVSISKDKEFDIQSKIYNRTDKQHQGLELITILPYNDINNSSFRGEYKLDLLDMKSTMCTTTPSAIVEDNNNLINDGGIIWEDCSKFTSNNYVGVTALKTKDINLNPGEFYTQKFNIIPYGNSYADSYKVEAYVKTEDNRLRKINPITVSVESIKITGVVWEDFDNNGLMTNDESRIPDVELKLYDSETNEIIDTKYSDKNGVYTFDQINFEDKDKPLKFYVLANFNTAKYSLTQRGVEDNKSINSSFCLTNGSSCSEGNVENEELQKVVRTDDIEITNGTRLVGNINLGLALKKEYSIKLNKYITKAEVTNALGVTDVKDFGKVSFAKLDIKDISNVSIKITYTIEIENTGYYPGYVYNVRDFIPDGTKFNEEYPENDGWTLSDSGYLENTSLMNTPIRAGEKKYITLCLDLIRKEAGSFVNYAMVDDSDLIMYSGTAEHLKNGGVANE